MSFQDNELLFGADKTARIVVIEMGDTGTVKVYRREENGATACDIEPFHPFVWADSDVADLGMDNAGVHAAARRIRFWNGASAIGD
ncbi:MAG: hypothetical protein H0V56_08385 [Chthoniobacterales bacterium]|nr:hypothetical protein [Chthoniobacterales bacterium]